MGARLFKNWWLVLIKGLALTFLPLLPESSNIIGTSIIPTILLVAFLCSLTSSLVYSLPPRYSIWHFEAMFDIVLFFLSIFLFNIGEGFFLSLLFLGYVAIFGVLTKLAFELRQFLTFVGSAFFCIGVILLIMSITNVMTTYEEVLQSPQSLSANISNLYQSIFPKYTTLFLHLVGIAYLYLAIRLKIITNIQQHLIMR